MPNTPPLVLTITRTAGRCRWCGCTYHDPCPPGCAWVDAAQTLCSECEGFDRALRSRQGRREAVEAFNIGVEEVGTR